MNRASSFLSFHPSALKTLRLAALFQCSLYLSLRVSGREMYLPVRTVCSLNSPIRAMWNGMFKLYWCHIHDPHTSQQQQSLCDFTDNKNTTHEEQVFVSLLYLGQTARQCMSALITGELCWDKKLSNKYKTEKKALQGQAGCGEGGRGWQRDGTKAKSMQNQ